MQAILALRLRALVELGQSGLPGWRGGAVLRVAGLLALLGGSLILMLPVFGRLLHRSWAMTDDSLIGGAMLCLGIAAVMISRATS